MFAIDTGLTPAKLMNDCDSMEEGEIDETHDTKDAMGFSSEEAISDNGSDNDELEFSLRPILPVAPLNAPFDMDAVPMTGEEYLRLVRMQTATLPFAVRTNESIQELETLQNATPTEPSITYRFSSAFIEECLQLCDSIPFESMQVNSEAHLTAPGYGSQNDWRQYLYQSPRMKVEELLLSHTSDDKQLLQLIKYHADWFSGEEEASLMMTEHTFKLLVYILRLVDVRMTPGQVHVLRTLAKVCTERLTGTESNGDALKYLSAIIILIATRFGQHDLLQRSPRTFL